MLSGFRRSISAPKEVEKRDLFLNHNATSVKLPQQVIQIQYLRKHLDGAILPPGPLLSGAVPVKLHAVVIRIIQIDRFRDAVITGADNGVAVIQQTFVDEGQITPGRVENGDVVEAWSVSWCWS